MAVTTRDGDYIGRALINPEPGVSDALDYMGRDVGDGDTDFMGRSLIELHDEDGDGLPYVLPFQLGAN